jgi:hypothetical protein
MGEPSGLSFTPSTDVAVVLNFLLDSLERRAARNTQHESHIRHSIKASLPDLSLQSYFSQTDPLPRLVANEQFQRLEKAGLLRLVWIPGETGHLLQTVILLTPIQPAARGTEDATLYDLLRRTPVSDLRSQLESHLLGEKFRYSENDWRSRAVRHSLKQLRAGKSPAPFSLSDSDLTQDMLTALAALPGLQSETPYRIFSVRIFNDSKRLEAIKSALVSLVRLGNPEWKRLPAEDVLRELNLVANPGYIHLSGNWQLTTTDGQILSLGGFSPSVGFPAAQTTQLESVTVHAPAALCIENLTAFHEFVHQAGHLTHYAVICTYGNPSPAVRRILRLIRDETPIYHWSDLDYGGFNILSQMRRLVSERVHPYRMDIETLEANAHFARPLTASDRIHLKRLLSRPELRDVRPTVEHLLKRELKLEQEGIGSPIDKWAFSSTTL